MKIYSFKFKSESGDSYQGGAWIQKPSKEELAKYIIYNHWSECEYWLKEEDKNYEWAIQNPLEALEICLIYPDLASFDVQEKIQEVPLKMEKK